MILSWNYSYGGYFDWSSFYSTVVYIYSHLNWEYGRQDITLSHEIIYDVNIPLRNILFILCSLIA